MKYLPLGKTEIQLSHIIMGTWQAGKTMWVGIQDDQILKALKTAYESGITTFDTAEIYGNGYSERMIAKAVGDMRDKVVYASKVFYNHLQYNQVIEACHRSLKNLHTDYLDLYQIHWPPGAFGSRPTTIQETMSALNYLKDKGKIRAIGVSNFSLAQLKEACQYGTVDSVQPPFSLFWRHVAEELIPFCQEQKISILAYAPLAQGLLTGKFGRKHTFSKGDNRIYNKLFQGSTFQHAQEALEKLQPIVQKKNITLGNLALAWVLAQPQTCAIVGARNANQVLENIKASDVQLTPEEIEEMKQISLIVTKHLNTSNPIMWAE